MSFRIETILQGLETAQYAGKGQAATGIDGIARAAREVEEMGVDGATTAEAGHDPYLPIVVAAEHTKHIYLATNVAIAFPRSPMVTAQLAWDLQHLSGGRFQLGLGTQVKGHNERRYAAPWSAPPGPRLRDYLLCVKAMFEAFQTGKRPSFTSEHYQFTLMPPFFNPGPIEHPGVPIYIAAVNKYMIRLAGEMCDGLRLHPICTFKYTAEIVRPTIAKAAAKAGRNPADIDVVGAPFLAISKDEAGLAAAKDAIRQRISFYASTRTYHSVLEFHGWHDVGAKLHQYSVEGKWQEMAGLITDDMLEEFAIIGTYDDLVEKLRERSTGVFSTVMIDLPPDLRQDRDRARGIVRELRQ